ncbi:MAG TPA: alpha-amylase family glycosyl hydrolase [Candidatus Kapabacteria bacterium]|nr:alpha-amylase family glycosyl hydrolase [Candidatus Kapabacteria bacterium]
MFSHETILQAFYWDCPREAGVEFAWWPHVEREVAALAEAGFTSLWLPPVSKTMNSASMGYDPYDYYDLGSLANKGNRPETWFGSEAQLRSLIATAHEMKLRVFADLVVNHNSGGDELEVNAIDQQSRWTKFNPMSGKFVRDWRSFHPSPYDSVDEMPEFEGMPDLCHRNPQVFSEIMTYAAWLVEEIGFDGFRYDMVKAYGAWLITALQEFRYSKPGEPPFGFRIYGVAECWEGTRFVSEWLAGANHWSENEVQAFDFELRGRLRDLCDRYGYSLRELLAPGTLLSDHPELATTFVENHDVHRPGDARHHHPVVNDKMLAYAFILMQPSDACVFWKDYFEYGLGMPGSPHGIAQLVALRGAYAIGAQRTLWLDDDLYIMARGDATEPPGLVFVLNNRGDRWNGASVATPFQNARLVPLAWRGTGDNAEPETKRSDGEGRVDLWAPPRGYAVYVPRG